MIYTMAIVGAAAIVSVLLDRIGAAEANLIMVLLLAVAVVASLFETREAIVGTVLSVLLFNFLFVDPRLTFAVSESQYLLTFAVMLGVALLISSLTLRLRANSNAASERERRTSSLYALSRDMVRSRTSEDIAEATADKLIELFGADVAISSNRVEPKFDLVHSASGFEEIPAEREAAQHAINQSIPSGRGTTQHADAKGVYVPLKGSLGPVGVLALLPASDLPLSSGQTELLEAIANNLGLALERARLAKEAQDVRIQAESEIMRNALLSSISHDLRTPLTTISGAAGVLVNQGGGELAESIYHEAQRLNLQVQNILDIARLQGGNIQLKQEWHVLEEIIGSALRRTHEVLGHREVIVNISPSMPLLHVDGELIEKLLINLFENISIHASQSTRVEIQAVQQTSIVRIIVSDNGPGIAAGDEIAVFERFAQGPKNRGGLGLGLAICRAIAKAHEGRIWVRNRTTGGAEFHIELPLPDKQPDLPHE